MISLIRKSLSLLNYRKFRAKYGCCPLCGKTVFVRLNNSQWAIRCIRCRGSIVAMAISEIVRKLCPDLCNKTVYELSSRGAFFNFLNKNVKELTFSEYFDIAVPGSHINGVRHQDVQQLTFEDESFDLCTSTEVFEHVPNDIKGFSEVYRILKKEGKFVFTVPLNTEGKTKERATIDSKGRIQHFLPAEYHDDRIRGRGTVLCFRNYGFDIVEKLKMAGFKKAVIMSSQDMTGWGFIVPVIVAYKELDKNDFYNNTHL